MEAIESILGQTYTNIELIIIDDASTDNSWHIIKAYQKNYPETIRIFRNKKNLKQAATVEHAMRLAKGDFIARMDADDVALPSRLEKQLNYLLEHEDTIALGGQCALIDSEGYIIGEKRFPTDFEAVYRYIFQFIPLQQPTLMIARNRIPSFVQFYNPLLSPVEDVEMLFRLFRFGKVENLPDTLLLYRIHDHNSSRMNLKKSFFLTFVSRVRGVLLYGYKPTLTGIVMTLCQAAVALLLPQKFALFLYAVARKTNMITRPKPAVGFTDDIFAKAQVRV